jgi:hypothetical protein
MHQGSIGHARPERRYNVGVADLGEFMAFLRKTSDVVPYGLPLFLPATLQIRGVFGPHICVLEIAGKNLLEILLAIDRVSGQVIEPSSGRVSQIDGEKLNDKQVAICPARPAGEVVVL